MPVVVQPKRSANAELLSALDERTQALEARRQTEKAVDGVKPVKSGDIVHSNYFRNYTSTPIAQMTMSNLVAFNKEGVYLYESSSGGKKSLTHVIWMGRDVQQGVWSALPKDEWEKLRHKPELLDSVNRMMVESMDEAREFYPWKIQAKGFIVEGGKGALAAGNVHGIKVSHYELRHLIDAVDSGDQAKQAREHRHFTAQVVHEFTHNERDDGLMSSVSTEIASHVAQLAFDPKDNGILNRQFAQSLDNVGKWRDESGKLDLYDSAQYAAMLLTADELAKENAGMRDAMERDGDHNKINALKQMHQLITDKDSARLKAEFLPKVMADEGQALLEKAKAIEGKWGIRASPLTIS